MIVQDVVHVCIMVNVHVMYVLLVRVVNIHDVQMIAVQHKHTEHAVLASVLVRRAGLDRVVQIFRRRRL